MALRAGLDNSQELIDHLLLYNTKLFRYLFCKYILLLAQLAMNNIDAAIKQVKISGPIRTGE